MSYYFFNVFQKRMRKRKQEGEEKEEEKEEKEKNRILNEIRKVSKDKIEGMDEIHEMDETDQTELKLEKTNELKKPKELKKRNFNICKQVVLQKQQWDIEISKTKKIHNFISRQLNKKFELYIGEKKLSVQKRDEQFDKNKVLYKIFYNNDNDDKNDNDKDLVIIQRWSHQMVENDVYISSLETELQILNVQPRKVNISIDGKDYTPALIQKSLNFFENCFGGESKGESKDESKDEPEGESKDESKGEPEGVSKGVIVFDRPHKKFPEIFHYFGSVNSILCNTQNSEKDIEKWISLLDEFFIDSLKLEILSIENIPRFFNYIYIVHLDGSLKIRYFGSNFSEINQYCHKLIPKKNLNYQLTKLFLVEIIYNVLIDFEDNSINPQKNLKISTIERSKFIYQKIEKSLMSLIDKKYLSKIYQTLSEE